MHCYAQRGAFVLLPFVQALYDMFLVRRVATGATRVGQPDSRVPSCETTDQLSTGMALYSAAAGDLYR